MLHGARSVSNGLTIPGFADEYSDTLRTRVSNCRHRRAITQERAEHVVGPEALMTLLRDHGPGRSGPRYSWLNGGMAAPCMHGGGMVANSQSTASWVADLRDGDRHWVDRYGRPLHQPVQAGDGGRSPRSGPVADTDDGSLWWRHEHLHRLTLRDHGDLLARYRHARDRTESTWLADPPSSAVAFGAADELEAEWLADVAAADVPDRRPRWLRRMWDGLDEAASTPAPARAAVAS